MIIHECVTCGATLLPYTEGAMPFVAMCDGIRDHHAQLDGIGFLFEFDLECAARWAREEIEAARAETRAGGAR